ncbi:MAG: hypothetical protein Q8K82_18115 [Gemmatimonadaceae bacterium]|nr:hypothetical protein [Gemmatimonadaceae bacterium]
MMTPLLGRLLYALFVCGALAWLIRTVLFLRAAQRDARTAHRDLEARLNVLEAEAARRRAT